MSPPASPPGAGHGYRIAVSPSDVGARVSLRRVLCDGREGLGDVVGELLSWTDGVLAVRRRDGSVERVPEATLVGAKVVPPAPDRSR